MSHIGRIDWSTWGRPAPVAPPSRLVVLLACMAGAGPFLALGLLACLSGHGGPAAFASLAPSGP